MQTFVLAGGCFWCLDAVYRTLIGVTDVVSGYTGGTTDYPDYDSVCTGSTGHAEAVKVVFDETVIPASVILDVFFSLHDPRQLNRQGNDVGTQYRSAMFYADEDQKQQFIEAGARATEAWDGELATVLSPLGKWWDAEEYHQNFFARNPNQGYCLAVALPKIIKIRKSYAKYVLAS
jgi:peptide-methionine (S)-S-oxide reductase